MARKKTGDNQPADQKTDGAGGAENTPNVQADQNSVAIGGISIGGDVSGNITIGNTGYTVEQVSVLLTQITSTFQLKPFDGRCPYKGLEVFEEEDAELFFGRERLVEDLLSRVKESRTVFITGPSGSGKSSLVRAGLIHTLRQGGIKGSQSWLYETMKPGREPLKELALAFSRLKGPDLADYFQAHAGERDALDKCVESVLSGHKEQRFVLFVDQFEEVFTQINREEERIAFINMLAHAGTAGNGRVIVLFAMRSDFVSNCATYPALNELLSTEFRQIGAMQPDELVSAIALPARHVGLPIEEELIARIINDMKGEPGALPLMQFALKDLFDAQQAEGGVIALTLKDYLKHGGIHKSLERHADSIFATLSENEQELARSIFSGLIEIGRGTQDTKRTALFDELVPANTNPTEVLSVVQRLADARLIITDEQAGKDTVTISHEKLIDAWPWLKKLVNENRDTITLQNQIASDAKEWEEHKGDASYLYAGARLANAREQLEAKKLVLSGLSQEFVRAGTIRRQRGRLALIAGLSTIILLLFSAVLAFSKQANDNAALALEKAKIANTAQAASTQALLQEKLAKANADEAQRQAAIAQAGEHAALALIKADDQFDLGLLLGLQAIQQEENARTEGALLSLINSHPNLNQYAFEHDAPVTDVAISSHNILASASEDHRVLLWDLTNPTQPVKLLSNLLHQERVASVAFSKDGEILASGSYDSAIFLWNVHNPNSPTALSGRTGHQGKVNSVAFSPNGEVLASGSTDKTIILWNVTDPVNPVIFSRLPGHNASVTSIAFDPEGKMLVSGSADGTIILWDINDLFNPRILFKSNEHALPVLSVTFSPDGKLLAAAGDDTIMLWDLSDMTKSISTIPAGTVAFRVLFSPDGKSLISGGYDKTITVWNVTDPRTVTSVSTLSGHSEAVLGLAISPDGKNLVSGGFDKSVIVWNLGSPIGLASQLSLPSPSQVNTSLALSPDGDVLALSTGKDIVLWDWDHSTVVPTLSKLPTLSGHNDLVRSIAFRPDGKLLASADWEPKIILWDMSNPTHPSKTSTFNGQKDDIFSVAFSPDGRILASGSKDHTVVLWNVIDPAHPTQLSTLQHGGEVHTVAFSPDGKTLAAGSSDNALSLWDIKDPTVPKKMTTLVENNFVILAVAFSPDGKTMAVAGTRKITLWDISDSSNPVHLASLSGHNDDVMTVAFSHDGKHLASGSLDHTIILWDVSNQSIPSAIATLLGHKDNVFSIVFSLDDKTLVSTGLGKDSTILWDLDPHSWIQKGCQRVGRNFTRSEWAQYFPNEEYHKTCEQWPLEPELVPGSSATPSP